MAQSMTRLEEVRESVKRMQVEGERLVGRLRQDARTLVERNRPEVLQLGEDVRKRAERALEDIQSQQTRVVRALEDLIARLRVAVVRTLRVPDLTQFEAVSRRLAEAERRLDRLAATKPAESERAA